MLMIHYVRSNLNVRLVTVLALITASIFAFLASIVTGDAQRPTPQPAPRGARIPSWRVPSTPKPRRTTPERIPLPSSGASVKQAAAILETGGKISEGSFYSLSVLLARPSLALSDGGCLDPAFGVGGKVTTDYTGQDDEISAIVLQPDGKIVAVGTAGSGPVTGWSFALARYNSDGSLDTTFGVGGKVTTNFSGNNDSASSAALQPDGKILVAGDVGFDPLNHDSAVARYLADGTLDSSFGSGGLVTIDFDSQHNAAIALQLQPDGKIVTLNAIDGLAFDTRWALVRYNPDGSLDGTFGSGGKVITNIGPADDRPTALTLQSDGKILATGLTLQGANNQVALVRYETDGSLDATFGSGGIVMTGVPGEDAGGFDLRQLPSGQIVVAGGGPGAGAPDFGDFLLLRYNSDGSLDTTFGTGGFVLTDFRGSTDNGLGIAVDASGRILVVGQAFSVADGSGFAMARCNPDGSLDASFGTGGKVITDFFGGVDGAADVLIQPDGKIVLGGTAANPPEGDLTGEFALARYLDDGCNRPPDCSAAQPSVSQLWPPNHSLHAVSVLGVTDPDGDPVTITITGITQDEPTHGPGSGDASPDGFGVGTSQAQLRAERSGSGNGRVYVIQFTASDGRGDTCSGSVSVGTPHDQGKESVPIDDGQLYDSTLP